jgi:ABC-2 type transport system ATP-binding protein
MIRIDNLQRLYDDFVAVDKVSFDIQQGEIVGLLGHNGAGKTTIMKMIAGYLEPNRGQIEIDGLDMASQRSEIQRRIGYLPEVLPVYPEMNVADYLDYAARLKGLSDSETVSEVRRVVKATDLVAKLIAPISTLSRGYKQRLGVAQAILGNPRLLILDEPTNGLDPTQTRQMRELIRSLSHTATIIISTHIMQEVDALCDRVLIMRAGELALDASLDELRHSNRLIVHSDISAEQANELLLSIAGVEALERCNDRLRLTLEPGCERMSVTHEVAASLIGRHHRLFELRPEQRDLESVFREINESVATEVRHAA